nr:late blight resistance protein R1-A-like [Coffea arabica]
MEISCSSSTDCFDFALDYLDWLNKTFKYELHFYIEGLEIEVSLLQSFDLYLTKCKRKRRRNHEICLEQDAEEKDVTSFRIQSLIITGMQDLDFACWEYLMRSRLSGLTQIKSELTIFQEAIELFFETDIKESCINFLLDYYWLRDPELVIDFIDSVSKNLSKLRERDVFETLKEKLMFLKHFIHFAMLHGVEGQQLMDLLIHAEVVAIDALRLISIWWFDGKGEVRNGMELQISQLIGEKINPTDPQVRETYIHVLTASKLSRSSDTSALEKNKHLVVDFVDCLVHNIMELLESCTSILVPIIFHMQKLLDGLRFLSILLRHPEKFKELRHGMKSLIGVVVCDAAIVIFSLSVNQLIKEGLAKETDFALFHLLKVLKFVRAEVAQVYPVTSVSPFGFPRTNELGSMDFLLENLIELESCNGAEDSIAFPNDQIHTVLDHLVFLRSFLGKMVDQHNRNGKLQALWSRVIAVAYRTEFVIDSIVIGDKHEYLESVVRDIQLLRTEIETYECTRHDTGAQRTNRKSFHIESKRSTPVLNEVLDDEVKTIIDRLTRGSKLLDLVSIVGMAGLGKTTLANRVYNDPLISSHFHILAWCTVYQVYSIQDLLLQILCSISAGSHSQYLKMDEDDLAEMIYKRLKGNRYLVILDDVWEIEVWNLVKGSLPDDANGSRILFTSRIELQFSPDSKAHHHRQLTDKESWKLLQKKLFGKEGCPPRLIEVGSQIAKFCRGLPLTVVLVAGILANTAEDCWEEVAISVSSSIILDDEYCRKTLELSYSHLPDDLKSCLLYFCAFSEGKSIRVSGLSWLWISEGFVRKTEGKDLEDVADNYLKALVDRSLVMVIKQRSMGGAKSCRLHNLVHEFCVGKIKEENFIHIIRRGKDPFSLASLSSPYRVHDANSTKLKTRELMLSFPNLRTIMLDQSSSFSPLDFEFSLPKLLRVLLLEGVKFVADFPMELVLLVHLRFLLIDTKGIISIPSAIANLSTLKVANILDRRKLNVLFTEDHLEH